MSLRLPVLMLVAGLVAGCGFRLAGTRPLPEALRSVHVDLVAPYRVSEPPIETALRSLLERRGAEVQSQPGRARVLIRLSDLKETREVLSIGADGKALEFQLITQVNYQVSENGRALLPPSTLSVSRDFSFNAQQVLAKEAEEARLRAFIQGELAELLMLRLEAAIAAAAAGSEGAAPAP